MSRIFIVLFFLVYYVPALHAQDTLVLIDGRMIPVMSFELSGNNVRYQKAPSSPEKKIRTRKINAERVFSIRNANGAERVIYLRDTLDPIDFTKDEMRLFIQGEQDASRYYKNNIVKGSAFLIGAAGGFLGFYGIAVPPLYSTIVGSFSPNMKKQVVSDPALLNMSAYLEGYEKKVRDRKIRNSLVSGMIGLAAGIISLNIIYH